jgi:hypothetical protein
MERCPICRATLNDAETCRRCRAELGSAIRTERMAEKLRTMARFLLRCPSGRQVSGTRRKASKFRKRAASASLPVRVSG